MLVCYIAGPYKAKDNWGIERNVRAAEELSLRVWTELGAAAVCPHANTRFFQGTAPDKLWLDGDLAILAKCDAILLVPGYQNSEGTLAEIKEAHRLNIPVFQRLEDLGYWMEHWEIVSSGKPIPTD